MKRLKALSLFFPIFLLFSCATLPDKADETPVRLFGLEGTVLGASGPELVLAIPPPSLPKTPESVVADIANQVVYKSYLLEGTKIMIEGREGLITEVRGNQVKATFTPALSFPPGRKVSVSIPKKTIAVVDFEIIGAARKERGRVVLEGLSSALIDTGQFIVVERTKLKAIMNEIQLSLSGMTRPTADGLAGKLLSADLILTGTLTDLQDDWDINLRILNVRTGQALSSVSMRTRLFKAMEMRDAGAWEEDFEDARLHPSWVVRSATGGTKAGKKKTGRTKRPRQTSYSVQLDTAQGALDSRQSLRIDFDFSDEDERDFYALGSNRKKRDLTFYKGAEFYARGTEALTGQFYILTSSPDDPNKIDQWTGLFPIDTTWKQIRIPFDEMVVSRGWIKGGAKRLGAAAGDQVMRLNRVEGVQVGLGSGRNDGISGSLWVDKIRFYSD